MTPSSQGSGSPGIPVRFKELYEAIWAEPMRKVAKTRLGVSDVALSKACRRHSIPVPGRGYWAQLAAGRAPAQPVLPELDSHELPVVTRAAA